MQAKGGAPAGRPGYGVGVSFRTFFALRFGPSTSYEPPSLETAISEPPRLAVIELPAAGAAAGSAGGAASVATAGVAAAETAGTGVLAANIVAVASACAYAAGLAPELAIVATTVMQTTEPVSRPSRT